MTQQEYYKRADVWPLAPDGEILVVIMCEEAKAIKNLPKMLGEGPGNGVGTAVGRFSVQPLAAEKNSPSPLRAGLSPMRVLHECRASFDKLRMR